MPIQTAAKFAANLYVGASYRCSAAQNRKTSNFLHCNSLPQPHVFFVSSEWALKKETQSDGCDQKVEKSSQIFTKSGPSSSLY